MDFQQQLHFEHSTTDSNKKEHHLTSDSFFSRVFGHQSHEQRSVVTANVSTVSPRPTQTLSSSILPNPSHHTRNSSTSTISSNFSSAPSMPLQRRRSFDSTKTAASSSHPLRPESPIAHERSRPAPRIHFYDTKHNQSSVPFPRGGRHIGEQIAHHAQPAAAKRNESADQSKQTQADASLLTIHTPKDKKRNIWGRFGKKKSRTDLNASSEQAGVAHISDASSSALSIASSNASVTSFHPRKRSREYDQQFSVTHPLELQATDDPYRAAQKYSAFSNTTSTGDRKRSVSSITSRKGKDRERSDGSLSFGTEVSSKEEIELDQNFGNMTGIIRPEYYGKQHKGSLGESSMQTSDVDPSISVENWEPPDSWAVKTQGGSDGSAATSAPVQEEEMSEYDSYSLVEQERWDIPRKNFCIRIFRPDATFCTLQVPLATTTSELIHRLAGKFFLHDLSKYNLTLRQGLERALQPNERPVQIQKMILEQMGYTEQENLEDVGREDNSYLLRFTFGPKLAQKAQDEADLGNYQYVSLAGRSLPTVPIFLYKHASSIVSLDLSKNLQMEIPVDFIQSCSNVKHLLLLNNEYITLPSSIRELQKLEHLNISGNRLRDLQHAGLEKIEQLRTLRCLNNRLETLPRSFQSFKYLTILFISNNSFTKFPEVICEITSLAYLDISFNKIVTFPDEIGNLVNLVGLFAIANRLTGSLPLSFAKLQKLQELDIRQNLITDLDVIGQLPKLEIVFVDYNAISIVSFDFRNIRQLKMRKNHLTQFNLGFCLMPENLSMSSEIPSSPIMPTMLTDLNLSNCKLTSLPDDLFLITTSVENLVLDDNALNSIPSSIGALRNLCRLSVQNNDLETIPAQIFKLGELKDLDAQKNNLKMLPKEIWMCASLQTLNCSSNLLESFPEPYSAPGIALQLSQADISTSNPPTVNDGLLNQFSHAGQTMGSLANSSGESQHKLAMSADSTVLNGSSSGLQPPPNFNPPSFFASPRNHPPPLSLSLRHLLLGDNRLTDDIWSPLSLFLELRKLNLSFNDLYEIPSEGLCHQHLYELYLSGNHLTSLPADDIEKLSYLRVLAVNGNKLQTLPAEIGKLRKLLVLDVGNNVLKYNINNWFYDWNW
ncbi:cysteinyl-tRNA synthetase [Apophysomyces sp. BC1021]|nr:cysteinyl-tRNA synthetase [Apophysomyces sp. BC1021]